MSTLFEIGAELEALDAVMTEAGGELTPELEADFDAYFAALGAERDAKLDNYAAFITELEARTTARNAEAKRLTARAALDARAADALKARLKMFFERIGEKKIETPRYTLTLVNHGGKRPLVLKVDADELPRRFLKVKYEADREAIRQGLERGDAIAAEVAELGERGASMRIK